MLDVAIFLALVIAVAAWRMAASDARLYRRLWLEAPSKEQFDEMNSQHEGAARSVTEFRRMSEEYERLRKLEGVRVRQIRALAERVAAQSELLSKTANSDDYKKAKAYLTQLFEKIAPQCEPFDTLSGLATQIDNYIAGLHEQKAESERRLGYLYPRGLETPPSVEDPLSPTWCRETRVREHYYCEACNHVYDKPPCPVHGQGPTWWREGVSVVPANWRPPTVEEWDRIESQIANAPDGRILTAAEVIAMGKDPAVQAAVNREGSGRSA